MTSHPSGRTEAAYEQFSAECPYCSFTNIFNRASDLGTFNAIDFREVNCQKCAAPFTINGDSINTAYEMFLFGCHELIERKRYMQCVLSAAQAYELFLSHFLYVQLIYRSFATERSNDLHRLNELIRILYRRVSAFTFEPMRRLVIGMILDGVSPASLRSAEKVIAAIPIRPGMVPTVPRARIESIVDDRLRILMLGLNGTAVNRLRNRVAHKDASRPNEEETRRLHLEARQIIFGLTARLTSGRRC